jgi:hypothetical protein
MVEVSASLKLEDRLGTKGGHGEKVPYNDHTGHPSLMALMTQKFEDILGDTGS